MKKICFGFISLQNKWIIYIAIGRSSHQMYSIIKGVLRNFAKFTGKHLCQSLFFNKVVVLSPVSLLKKRLWQRCFPVNFVKFLRTHFLQKTSRRLLLFIHFFAISSVEVIKRFVFEKVCFCFWEYNEFKTKHLFLIKNSSTIWWRKKSIDDPREKSHTANPEEDYHGRLKEDQDHWGP